MDAAREDRGGHSIPLHQRYDQRGLDPGLKLWALDLDGTLVQADGSITAADRAAVAAARGRGEQVVIATGRAFAGSIGIARALDLRGPMIVTTGGQIVDIESEAPLHERRLEIAAARDVLAFCRERGYAAAAFRDLGRDVRWVAMPQGWSRPPVVDPRLPESLTEDPEQVVILGGEAVLAVMSSFAGLHILPLPDGQRPRAAHILHPEATKGQALLRLAAHLGLSPLECAAVGDSANDVSMLEAAGHGFAMAGSPPYVVAAAGGVVGSVAEAMRANGPVVFC
jgi:hydroxymethylpyrimidine pyrophosphatase-like HAD family hydrolase